MSQDGDEYRRGSSRETVRRPPRAGLGEFIRPETPLEGTLANIGVDQPYLELTNSSQGPFQVLRITWDGQEDTRGHMRDVLDHWHPAMEIVYTLIGHATHYIDACRYKAHPGSVFVINSHSVHRIESDVASYRNYPKNTVVALVLHIDIDYLCSMIADFDTVYFRTQLDSDDEIEGRLMRELGECADLVPQPRASQDSQKLPVSQNIANPADVYRYLHETALVNELLYRMCSHRFGRRDDAVYARRAKNIERLRAILDWVNDHYMERVSEQMIALRFSFTKEYFARFFKANTGMTFMQYVTRRRLLDAVQLLRSTDLKVSEIALECGFSDARGLISAFGRHYGITPLQYRKSLKEWF